MPPPSGVPATVPEGGELAWRGRPGNEPWARVSDAPPAPDEAVAARIARGLRSARRPLIVAGPQPDATLAGPLSALARSSGAPLLADPLSQLRWGAHDRSAIIDRYDATLRHERTAGALTPDFVLRIGGPPTSKVLLRFLEQHASAHQVVVDAARWPDPTLVAAEVVHAEPSVFCQKVLEQLADDARGGRAEWLAEWRRADALAGRALADHSGALDEPFEGRALAEVAALAPDGGALFVSSSMPVRDLDAFAAGDTRAVRVLGNRGANGIDGIVSTALGSAAALREEGRGPLVLVTGDMAFYHDMNGLLAGRLHGLDATIVVLNNDGGGIFSFLPQAAHREHFELLFGTPHGLEFAPAAAMYGARYTRADSWDALRAGVQAGVGGTGLHIVEMRTDRERNVELHRDAWNAVAAALDGGSGHT